VANMPMEEIEKLVGSRYALTVLAGKRARELRKGAPRLVNIDSQNPIIIALHEIMEGKIHPENLSFNEAAAMEEARQERSDARDRDAAADRALRAVLDEAEEITRGVETAAAESAKRDKVKAPEAAAVVEAEPVVTPEEVSEEEAQPEEQAATAIAEPEEESEGEEGEEGEEEELATSEE
jgi:DNA-directed RNA polymerase subunit omega